MKLREIILKNFRNFDEYHVALGRKTTVFIGRNGMGKTNLIEGMVKALSFIFSKQKGQEQFEFIRSSGQSIQRFSATDPRFVGDDFCYPLSIHASSFLGEEEEALLDWTFEQESENSGLKDSLFRDAYLSFWEHYNSLQEKPLFAYFSDGFPHKEIRISAKMNEKLESGFPLPANTGYYQWDDERSSAELWKTYFMQECMNNLAHPDAEKQRFVVAVNQKLREFCAPLTPDGTVADWSIAQLFVQFRKFSMRLMIEFADGSIKPFETLPAGYRRLFSLLLDLICRSYLLNKSSDSEGIVFIDEIDLHLHPSLAAEVLPRLQRAFPRIQFIVSTHSPMVISNMSVNQDNKIIALRKSDGRYYNTEVADMSGINYDFVLSAVMDAEPSNVQLQQLKEKYLRLMRRDKVDLADNTLQAIRGMLSATRFEQVKNELTQKL